MALLPALRAGDDKAKDKAACCPAPASKAECGKCPGCPAAAKDSKKAAKEQAKADKKAAQADKQAAKKKS